MMAISSLSLDMLFTDQAAVIMQPEQRFFIWGKGGVGGMLEVFFHGLDCDM